MKKAIFIQGFLCPKTYLNPLVTEFNGVLWNGPYIHFSPTEKILLNFKQQIKEESNKHGKLVLVGHSLGGVVARLMANDTEVNDRIDKIVTITTPIGKTGNVFLDFSNSIMTKFAKNDVLKISAKHVEIPVDNIIADNDFVVSSYYCIAPDAINHISYNSTHMSAPFSKVSLNIIGESLK